MKTLISSILLLTIASVSNAQNVNIPDTAFLYALIDEGVDTNGDSLISNEEAKAVTSLDVSDNSISDMTGIEAFINLDTLWCRSNQLISLDVSKNTRLIWLDCGESNLESLNTSNINSLTYIDCEINQITNLDVSDNSALTSLNFHDNQISNIDVSNNTALAKLYCFNNNLTSLDISKNIALTDLEIRNNQLTSLDVSKNTALASLGCGNNQLSSLNVSNNTALIELYCESNQLTSLNVSKNTALTGLFCGQNQLTELDVSNNIYLSAFGVGVFVSLDCSNNLLTYLDVTNNVALKGIDISNNPLIHLDISNNTGLYFLGLRDMSSLSEVCVWEEFPTASNEYDRFEIHFDTTGSPNVNFTIDCSITALNSYKEENSISIYPNPSDDIINVEIENIGNATIEIYNISGRLIFSKAFDSEVEKIDISGFSKGIYIVKVMQDNTLNVGKVVIK